VTTVASAAKILGRPALLERAAAWRAGGTSIALANGCFDILHVGHVRYLQAAAAEADHLVVAVNFDASASSPIQVSVIGCRLGVAPRVKPLVI